MRIATLVLFLLHSVWLGAGTFPGPDSSGVLLPHSTLIPLKLSNSLQSENLQEGDIINLLVVHDVVVGEGKVVISANAKATGKVTRLRKRGVYGRPALIEIEPASVRTVDGKIIEISGEKRVFKGKSKQGLAWAISILPPVVGLVFLSPYLLPVAAAGLLIKGGKASAGNSSLLEAYTLSNVRVKA
jgi:hypothetical protein